jgi:UDP-N-acetylglucosamine 2-epimerase (non-hydrolysing)
MKIVTILGTRPEIIRLSSLIPKLDAITDHKVIHTGQNFEDSLNDVFFRELKVRRPDEHLGIIAGSAGEQIGKIISGIEKVLIRENPDRVLILGDTNSGLSAIPAKRMGIPVFHMEAGNRCYDDRVPEEVNRRIIDHSSDVLMPYTQRSKENLVREGIERERIFVTGNPIFEVLQRYEADIQKSDILVRLNLKEKAYFLVTLHRAENVDDESRLKLFVHAWEMLAKEYGVPIVCSLHPRTRSKMERFSLPMERPTIRFLTPLGFFDFVALEKNAKCVLTDSGTVQEECSILGVPNVTLRDVTERPETIECGSNAITGNRSGDIAQLVKAVLMAPTDWQPPAEYIEKNVSDKVVKIMLSFFLRLESRHSADRA